MSPYFIPNSLRRMPRKHLGERTTTIPIWSPPLLQISPFPVIPVYAEKKNLRPKNFGNLLTFAIT